MENQTKQPTCEGQVQSHLESRIETIKELWQSYCNGEEPHPEHGSFNEFGLCFDYVPAGTFSDQTEGYFRYQLSWGGPADEFRFYTDAARHPTRIEYWFLNWFDGASRTLTGPDLDLMTEIWNFFVEIGSVDHELQKALEE